MDGNMVDRRASEPTAPASRRRLRLSVVICTKDRPSDLRLTLETLWRQTRLPDELVIIDDGRLDFAPLQAAAEQRGVAFVYHNKSDRPGLARSRRAGLEHSTGDILLYLDDDVSLEPPYLEALMEVYESDPDRRIGGASGVLVGHRYGRLQMLLLRFFGMEARDREGQILKSFIGVLTRWIDRPTEIQWLSGCNMSYRREAMAAVEIPPSIEDCTMSEDRTISYQVGRRHKLIGTPAARLVHRKVAVGRVGKVRGYEEVYYNYLAFRRFMPQDLAHRAAFGWLCVGYVAINSLRRDWGRAYGNLRGIGRILFGPRPEQPHDWYRRARKNS